MNQKKELLRGLWGKASFLPTLRDIGVGFSKPVSKTLKSKPWTPYAQTVSLNPKPKPLTLPAGSKGNDSCEGLPARENTLLSRDGGFERSMVLLRTLNYGELWHIPYYGQCKIYIINRTSVRGPILRMQSNCILMNWGVVFAETLYGTVVRSPWTVYALSHYP